MARFKVRAGEHVEDDGIRYRTGEVFETKKDRVRQFGEKFERVSDHTPLSKGLRPDEQVPSREVPLADEYDGGQPALADAATAVIDAPPLPPTTPNPAQLQQMSLKDLQKLAEEEEIPLGSAKTHADVLKIVKSALCD